MWSNRELLDGVKELTNKTNQFWVTLLIATVSGYGTNKKQIYFSKNVLLSMFGKIIMWHVTVALYWLFVLGASFRPQNKADVVQTGEWRSSGGCKWLCQYRKRGLCVSC